MMNPKLPEPVSTPSFVEGLKNLKKRGSALTLQPEPILRVLHLGPKNEDQDQLAVDIVAIHSLGEHAELTWTYKGSAFTASSKAKIDSQVPKRKGATDEPTKNVPTADGIFTVKWLEDSNMLPTEIPYARIMQFDYPSNLKNDTILPPSELAKKLRGFLIKERATCPGRSIIFIAYGFGGLILMEALKLNESPPNPILRSVIGLIFLATPFRQPGNLVDFAQSKRFGTFLDESRRRITVGQIDPLHQELRNRAVRCRRLAFRKIVRAYGIPVASFYETLPVEAPQNSVKQTLVVDKENSEIFSNTAVPFESSHLSMTKFCGPHDRKYRYVFDALTGFIYTSKFLEAARSGDSEKLENFLLLGADIKTRNRFGQTALHLAAKRGREEAAKFLLREGVDSSSKDKKGRTALHLAVEKKQSGIVCLLLQRGADIDVRNNEDKSPLQLAEDLKLENIIHMLKNQPRIEGPFIQKSKSKSRILKPELPRSQEALEACRKFHATVANFSITGGREFRSLKKPSIHDLLYDPLSDFDNGKQTTEPSFRWYHLPANNVKLSSTEFFKFTNYERKLAWVQELFFRLSIQDVDPIQPDQQHWGSTPHSRYMRSQFKDDSDVNSTSMSYEQQRRKMTFFMPFLNFETNEGREKMMRAILRADENSSIRTKLADQRGYKQSSRDEDLIAAYLNHKPPLHVRRTLDQFYYHMLKDTTTRDQDQVVYRKQKDSIRVRSHSRLKNIKIFMVDQMWLWIIDETLITSFPQRWNRGSEDKLDVLEGILAILRSPNRDPVTSVYDLAFLITNRCFGVFDRSRAPQELQFLDYFQDAIGSVSNKEAELFGQFNKDLGELSSLQELKAHEVIRGKKTHKKSKTEKDREKDLLESFNKIIGETKQLKEIKDIRDELMILGMVIQDQNKVWSSFIKTIEPLLHKSPSAAYELKYQNELRNSLLHEVDTMTEHSKAVNRALDNLLDLKQKQANASEARSARQQQEETARQGNTILVFTIVTIIFLPLSFLASFFALDVAEFPQDSAGNIGLDLKFVGKYLFGIGIAVALPFIILAFTVNSVTDRLDTFPRHFQQFREETERNISEVSDKLQAFQDDPLGNIQDDTLEDNLQLEFLTEYFRFMMWKEGGGLNEGVKRRLNISESESREFSNIGLALRWRRMSPRAKKYIIMKRYAQEESQKFLESLKVLFQLILFYLYWPFHYLAQVIKRLVSDLLRSLKKKPHDEEKAAEKKAAKEKAADNEDSKSGDDESSGCSSDSNTSQFEIDDDDDDDDDDNDGDDDKIKKNSNIQSPVSVLPKSPEPHLSWELPNKPPVMTAGYH